MCHNNMSVVTIPQILNMNINSSKFKKLFTKVCFCYDFKYINNEILKIAKSCTHTGSLGVYGIQLRKRCIHQRVPKETFHEPVFEMCKCIQIRL